MWSNLFFSHPNSSTTGSVASPLMAQIFPLRPSAWACQRKKQRKQQCDKHASTCFVGGYTIHGIASGATGCSAGSAAGDDVMVMVAPVQQNLHAVVRAGAMPVLVGPGGGANGGAGSGPAAVGTCGAASCEAGGAASDDRWHSIAGAAGGTIAGALGGVAGASGGVAGVSATQRATLMP